MNNLARETGYLKRLRKLSPYNLVCLMIGAKAQGADVTLEGYVDELDDERNISYTKQSLNAKFNDLGVDFMKELLEVTLQLLNKENNGSVIALKDSTSWQVPAAMAKEYPGSGGGGSAGGIKVQYEQDLSGRIYDMGVEPMACPDSVCAQRDNKNLNKNNLCIRDLGYTNIEALEKMESEELYYLHRLHNCNVYELVGDEYKLLSYKEILKRVKKNGIFDQVVYLTAKRFKTRLVAEKVPEDVYLGRIAKVKKTAKKKGYKVIEKNLIKHHLNLFITNTDLPAEDLKDIYRLRWQIELTFKDWKSNEKIAEVKEVKAERVLMELYAKLIWIVIKTRIEGEIAEWGRENGKPFSHMKIRKKLTKYSVSVWNGFTEMFDKLFDKIDRFHKLFKKDIKKGKDGEKHNIEIVLKKLLNSVINGLF